MKARVTLPQRSCEDNKAEEVKIAISFYQLQKQ